MSAAEVLIEHAYKKAINTSRAFCVCGWNQVIVNTHRTGMQLHSVHQLEALKAAGYTVISFDELSATESRLLAASLMAAANSVEVSDD